MLNENLFVITSLTIASFGIAVSSLCASLFVALSKPRNKIKTVWSLFSFMVGTWAAGLMFYTSITDYKTSYWGACVSTIAAILIPPLFFHFTVLLTESIRQFRPYVRLGYTVSIATFILATIQPRTFVADVTPQFNLPYFIKGGWLFVIYFWQYLILVALGLYILRYMYAQSTKQKRNQIKYIFLGTGLGFSGGFFTFLPGLDIEVYPLPIAVIPIYTIMTAYAIVKHNLMDIRIAIKKSLVYSLTVSMITVFYFLLIFLSERLFQDYFGYTTLGLSLLIGCVIALIFIPVRNWFQHMVDKLFFRGSIADIQQENELLRQEITQADKLKSIATLASGMAHEIKNPLTAVKTFTEYLPRHLEDREFLDKFARVVPQAVERIDRLVHELLHYAKPSPPEKKPQSIAPLIDEIIELLSNEWLKKNIKISKYYEPTHIALLIDGSQIKQALLNLFLNAIDAVGRDGEILIRTAVSNDQYLISIKDNGKGITATDRKRIFDPFFTSKDTGTGLGLSITYGIIQSHGGDISVQSELNAYTEFVIKLPLGTESIN